MGGARRQISLIKFVERGRILREEDGIFFFGFIINPEIFEDQYSKLINFNISPNYNNIL